MLQYIVFLYDIRYDIWPYSFIYNVILFLSMLENEVFLYDVQFYSFT